MWPALMDEVRSGQWLLRSYSSLFDACVKVLTKYPRCWSRVAPLLLLLVSYLPQYCREKSLKSEAGLNMASRGTGSRKKKMNQRWRSQRGGYWMFPVNGLSQWCCSERSCFFGTDRYGVYNRRQTAWSRFIGSGRSLLNIGVHVFVSGVAGGLVGGFVVGRW